MAPLTLCYHGVSDDWSHQLAVRPAALERQLRALLRRRFRPATAAEVTASGARLLHVTFDDAFDNVREAVPALERLHVPATVFAAAGFAEDGRPLAVPELTAEAQANPRHMKTMDWDELRALAERGVEIGSHTVTHAHLTCLTDRELDRELSESRVRCEDELGRPCRFLAYPYGEHDPRVQRATSRAGYVAAFALRAGASQANAFALPRVDLYRRDSLLRAMLKTSVAGKPGAALRSRVVRSGHLRRGRPGDRQDEATRPG